MLSYYILNLVIYSCFHVHLDYLQRVRDYVILLKQKLWWTIQVAEREAEMQDGDRNEEPRSVLYISPDPKVCDDNLDMIEFLLVVTLTK